MFQLRQTRDLFAEAIGLSNDAGSLAFETWRALKDEYKTAALYVNFYPSIYAATVKAKGWFPMDTDEAVETIIQYLTKNTPIIEANPKKYTPQYINKVTYNCVYCICHDRLIDKQRRELEVSPEVEVDGDVLSLFDTVVEDVDMSHNVLVADLWTIYDRLPEDDQQILWAIMHDDQLSEEQEIRKEHLLSAMRLWLRQYA